ncbi:MAG: PAS domain S-box protein [Oscillatoria princeps RMCB-10]|jgi:PAS domain S-box-containing protein|nr:PAS domain S-box protein [Oscillatoria princeps RMCB-10]
MPEVILGSYDLRLAALSLTIAIIASYTALDLAGRVTPASSRLSRLLWSAGGAVAMGTGIWSMHFIAMLAFKLPVPVSYDVPLTLLSWADAILASGLALLLFSRPRLTVPVLSGGSAVMGLGIASMHYLGMAAVRVPAAVDYDPGLVGLSVAIAIAASGAALWLAFQFRNSTREGSDWQKLGSACMMGVAISGMHYTGMWATCFSRRPELDGIQIEGSDSSWLAIQVGAATLILLSGTLLASLFDRRYAAQLVRQEALQESEKQIRSLLEKMPVGVILLDGGGKILLTNPVASELLELAECNLQGQSVFDLNLQLLDEEGKVFLLEENPFKQALAGSQPVRNLVAGVARPKEKDPLWLLLNLDPQLDGSGSVERVVCTFSNITDRKQAEKKLQQQAAAMAAATDGIAILNSSGEFIYTNQALVNIFGCDSAEELLGKSWEALYSEAELQGAGRECFSSFLQQGHCRIDAAGCRRDGTAFYHEIAVTLLEEGERIYIVRDITERKQAEEALRESKHFIEQIAQASANLLYIYDIIEDRNVYANRSTAAILGYTPEQIEDMGSALLPAIMHADDFAKIPENLQKLSAMGDGEIFEHEYRLNDPQGEWRTFFVRETAFARTPDGKLKQILGTATDITGRKALERALALREARLNAFFSCSPVGKAILDDRLRFAQINEPLAEINGLPVGEHLGKSLREVAPQLAPTLEPICLKVLATGQPAINQEVSGKVPGQPGIERHWVVSCFPIPGESNRPSSVGVVVVEITDRKRAESELRSVTERLQYLLTSSPAVIFSSQVEGDYKITFLSENAKTILGYEAREFLEDASLWPSLIHPEDRERIFAGLPKIFEAGHHSHEYRVWHKDGIYRWVYNQLRLVRDSAGSPIEMVGYVVDITERKQAEEALRESQRRYQTLAESSPVCIFHTDAGGNCLYVNQRWSSITGLSLENAVGSGWIDNLHPDDRERVRAEWILAAKARVPFQSECRFLRPDGQITWVMGQAVAEIGERGEVKGYIGTITDISERKYAEIALQQQLKRERLVAAVQERIRSSLNLELVLTAAVGEVRQFLAADRVIIYRFKPDWSGVVEVESVGEGWTGVLGIDIEDRCFRETYAPKYQQGRIRAIENIYAAGLSECHIDLLRRFEVRANLIVPILQSRSEPDASIPNPKSQIQNGLWGLLIAHQCSGERQWHESEIESLRQISVQLAIAIGQCTLFEQAQTEIAERRRAEAALRESEERFNLAVSGTHDGIWDWDLRTGRVYYSPVWMQILGHQEGELPQELNTWSNLLHPSDKPAALAAFSDHMEGKTPLYQNTHRMKHKDGRWVWVEVKGKCLRDAAGFPYRVTGTLADITERKLAEEALRESAQRERALAQVIQRMRQTLDIETIFRATTQELRQVLNCDRVLVYRFHPDWSGKLVAESAGSDWISLLQEQASNPQLTANAIENDRCAVKAFDSADALTVEDTYLQETRGGAYSRGASHLAVSDIYSAGFNDCYINLLEQFQARAYLTVPIFCGSQLWGLLASYQNSGSRQWKEAEIKVAIQIGSQLGVALQQAELLDRTKRQSEALQKAAVAADAANRAKSEFLSSMSHELRTPLNAILGFAQLMARDSFVKAEHQEYLGIINRAGEHLLSLINDILEMSKIEAGRTALNESSFNLIRFLDALEDMLRLKAESKGLQLRFDRAPDLPQFVKTDEGKLRQVLINILGNAMKFTEKGSVTLRVRVGHGASGIGHGESGTGGNNQSPIQNPKSEIQNPQSEIQNPQCPVPNAQCPVPHSQWPITFEIEDTGPGIALSEMDKLFEAFGQTETGRNSQQGTGLGLPISRKFVQLMGGDISVRSAPGEGSLFAFDIQVSVAGALEMQPVGPQRRVIGLAPNQPEYRILVVDDRSESRLLLVKLLTAIGFSVREAENGREAIAVWESWEPHLICMDMRMPVMNGYEATQQIKSTLRGQATVIVALTASAFEEDRKMVLDAGCDDFVRKPFQEEELLEKMSEHLGVKYIFEEPPAAATDRQPDRDGSPGAFQLAADSLKVMPAEWVAQVYRAAVQCSDDLILELLEQIPTECYPLAQALADLANNYQFDKIEELTQQEAAG